MTQAIAVTPERVTNSETRQITLDYIRIGTKMDLAVVKRTITKTFINNHGASETQTTVEQDVVRHYEIEELRRGDEFRNRRGYVLITDAIAHGLAVSSGPMASVSEFVSATSPVSLMEFPENIGLTANDVYVMKFPYEAVREGLDFFVVEYGHKGDYYLVSDVRESYGVVNLPRPIGCGPLNGFNDTNFDIEKAEAILAESPVARLDDRGRETCRPYGKNAKPYEALFFDVLLDKETYNQVLTRSGYYEVRGVDAMTAKALTLFELDILGLRAGGAAKIDSVKDYDFHGRQNVDTERLVSPEY